MWPCCGSHDSISRTVSIAVRILEFSRAQLSIRVVLSMRSYHGSAEVMVECGYGGNG